RGVIGDDGAPRFETPPVPLAENAPGDWNAFPALAVSGDTVDVVWQGGGEAWIRRLRNGASGYVWGAPHKTGARREGRELGAVIATDGDQIHIVTPSGSYAMSRDGGLTWKVEPIPLPPGTHVKTISLALDSVGDVTIAFSCVVREAKDTGKAEGSGGYWQLRTMQRTPDGRWAGGSDALAEFPVWGEPFPGQDILA